MGWRRRQMSGGGFSEVVGPGPPQPGTNHRFPHIPINIVSLVLDGTSPKQAISPPGPHLHTRTHTPRSMMAEQPPGALSAAFPPPPVYFTHFTVENLAALKDLRASDGSLPPTDQLPEELQYLVPPPLPEGSYRAFGETWTV